MNITENFSVAAVRIAAIIFLTALSLLSTQAATFTVTKTADTNDGACDADCSLREAVAEANNASSNDEILFSSLFNSSQTITLSGTELSIMNNGTLTITGTGANILSISGNDSIRIFSILNNASVTINSLKLRNGSSSFTGGAIYNGGILTVNNSIVSNSVASNGGGGIYNDRKTVTISGSTLSNNTSSIYNNEGTLSITNSTISNNNSAVYNFKGILTLNGSTVSNNISTSGAGIYNFDGNASITDSIISNNSITGLSGIGGGITNYSDASAPATMTINNSRITGNTSEYRAGGIMNLIGSLIITNSTIDNNRSLNSQGGGLYVFSGTCSISKSTVSNNTAAGGGGGIYNGDAITTINNSTISNNTGSDGGGIYSSSFNGPLTITNSTINGNTATNRGGGIVRGSGDIISVGSSIIANNSDNSTASPAPDFGGTLTSQGYNLVENTSGTTITGTTTGNILGRDPQLLPLGNYGGTLQTNALQPTSPAINAGNPNNFPATDQRGTARPQDGDLNGTALPDIGAYERLVEPLTVTKTADTSDGSCNADCSLREAFAAANAAANPDTAIFFDPSLFATAQTITLTGGQLESTRNGTLTIYGSGANLLTLDGNNQTRIFYFITQA